MKLSRYIFIVVLLITGCSRTIENTVPEDVALQVISKTNKKVFYAGEEIQLEFKILGTSSMLLVIDNAMGAITLSPTVNKDNYIYKLPTFISTKSGTLKWTLVHKQKQHIEGLLTILPSSDKKVHVESYLGPRSITAGNKDYAMHVIAPTDIYDNPLEEGTEIISSYQFESSIQNKSIKLKNLVGWTNIYSPLKSGRMLVTATCRDTNSKEFTTVVYPAKATDFKISYKRNHAFADGNQVIDFYSNSIKDAYGNTVSDGTLVNFMVTTNKGMQLSAIGNTINGIATARFLHPYIPGIWKAKAFITGTAESDSIEISFKSAISDFSYRFSQETRILEILDINSFMDQIVPDGIPISIKIFDDSKKLIGQDKTTSRLGKGIFRLVKDFYEAGNYTIEIRVADKLKTMETNLE